MSAETMNLIVTTVLFPILGALTTLISVWIKAKTNDLKERTDSEKLRRCLELAESAISSAVAAVSQTYVDALKKDDAFTKEDAELAFELAKGKALAIMGNELVAALQNELKSAEFEIWLDAKIEEFVRRDKAV